MERSSDIIDQLKTELPERVTLVAVSKTHTAEEIIEVYNSGQRVFGENRVQELTLKKPLLPDDIKWHLIGHLQTNKVKFIIPFIAMIESVDSVRLLETIDHESGKAGRVTDILLQIHIAREETKFGFDLDELRIAASEKDFGSYKNLRICGVMGMATFSNDTALVREEFVFLRQCFEFLRDNYFRESPSFREISMGMSGDYRIAIQEGSTMVRIGSLIFGERVRKKL